MDENLPWQARLAKANINITGVQYNVNHKSCVVCFEFPYHPNPGQTKWFKTAEEYIGIGPDIYKLKELIDSGKDIPAVWLHDLAPAIMNTVLSLRKTLEG